MQLNISLHHLVNNLLALFETDSAPLTNFPPVEVYGLQCLRSNLRLLSHLCATEHGKDSLPHGAVVVCITYVVTKHYAY